MEIDTLKPLIISLMSGCAFQTARLSDTLFRARKHDDSKLFTNKSQVDFPEPEHVKKIGRANRPGQPMMYLGNDGRTALYEVQPKADEYVTVSKWNVRDDQYLNLLFLAPTSNMHAQVFAKILRTRSSYLKKLGYTQRGIENINYIHNALHSEFSRPNFDEQEHIYRLSVAISEVLISEHIADGLLYQSIRSRNDFNVVIKPTIATKKLQLTRCDGLLVKEKTSLYIGFTQIVTTISIDEETGQLHWTEQLPGNLGWKSEGTKVLTLRKEI